jgi:hypothetical protein
MRTFIFKNMLKISFGDGQAQNPIPAFPGLESKTQVILLGDT